MKKGLSMLRTRELLRAEAEFETWLTGTHKEALARSFNPNAMSIVQSGKDKEDLSVRQAADEEQQLF